MGGETPLFTLTRFMVQLVCPSAIRPLMNRTLTMLISLSASLVLTGCDSAFWTGEKKTRRDKKQADSQALKKNKDVEDGLDENFQVRKLPLRQAYRKYAKDPDGSDYMQAALAALEEEDYWSAETLLNAVIEREPNNGRAYMERGRARYNAIAGADKAALNDLNKAISLGAGTANCYKFLARIYDAEKQPAKAIEALNMAVKLDPCHRATYKYRAAMLVEVKKYDQAVLDYNKALSFEPQDCDLHFLRAQLFESIGRLDDAIAGYRDVVEMSRFRKNDKLSIKGMAFKRLAGLLSKKGKHKEAIEILTQALSTEERDDADELLKLRGQEYALMNKYDRAIADFNQSIALAPEFARGAYEARAAVYLKLGKDELAEKDHEEAKRLRDKPAEKPVFELKE